MSNKYTGKQFSLLGRVYEVRNPNDPDAKHMDDKFFAESIDGIDMDRQIVGNRRQSTIVGPLEYLEHVCWIPVGAETSKRKFKLFGKTYLVESTWRFIPGGMLFSGITYDGIKCDYPHELPCDEENVMQRKGFSRVIFPKEDFDKLDWIYV